MKMYKVTLEERGDVKMFQKDIEAIADKVRLILPDLKPLNPKIMEYPLSVLFDFEKTTEGKLFWYMANCLFTLKLEKVKSTESN